MHFRAVPNRWTTGYLIFGIIVLRDCGFNMSVMAQEERSRRPFVALAIGSHTVVSESKTTVRKRGEAQRNPAKDCLSWCCSGPCWVAWVRYSLFSPESLNLTITDAFESFSG